MNIAWFAPLRRESAIGWRFGLHVCRALSQHANVDIWSPPPVDVPPDSPPVVTFTGEEFDASRLATYDVVVYNLGDNAAFHRDIFTVARRHPGIVVLHDLVLHNFLRTYYLLGDGGFPAYASSLERNYGIAGRELARRHDIGHPLQDLDIMARFPLFEDGIRGARGVIVHSRFLLDRVRAAYPGPSMHVPLAYHLPSLTSASKQRVGVPDDLTLIVSVGYINRNRHHDKVIAALARRPSLAERVQYHLVGPSSDAFYSSQLKGQIESAGLEDVVKFSGFADMKTLQAYLGAADIFVNIRQPAIEGASASVLEQMLAGHPTIVADAGSYAELPNDVVRKIAARLDVDELAGTLQSLVDDPSERTRLGERARAYATKRVSGEAWTAAFLPFAESVLREHATADLVERVATHLVTMRIDPYSPAIDTVVDAIRDLFCEKG